MVVVVHASEVWESVPLIHVPVAQNSRSLGVFLFFVISGFVIAARMPLESSLSRYLLRRYLRVLPLSFAATMVAFAVAAWYRGPIFTAPVAWWGDFDPGPYYFLKSLFIWPMNNWPYLVVTWSLPFEMIFYVVFGVIAMSLGQRRAIIVFAVGALFMWGYASLPQNYPYASTGLRYYTPTAYFVYFACGALAYEWLQRQPGAALPAALVVIGFAVVIAETEFGVDFYNFFVLLTGAGFMGLIVLLAGLELGGTAFTRPNALTWVGDISFSLYLVHLLVIIPFSRCFADAGLSPLAIEFLRLLVIAASIVAAALVFYRFERPVNGIVKQGVVRLRRAPLP